MIQSCRAPPNYPCQFRFRSPYSPTCRPVLLKLSVIAEKDNRIDATALP